MIFLVLGVLLAAALVPAVSIALQWRDAARRSDKHAVQIWALHAGPRPCWCAQCRQARRLVGLPAERPRGLKV